MFEVKKVLPFKKCDECLEVDFTTENLYVDNDIVVLLKCSNDYICQHFASLIDYKEE